MLEISPLILRENRTHKLYTPVLETKRGTYSKNNPITNKATLFAQSLQ